MRDAVAAVLLCGGKGARMDGADKGLLDLGGLTLAERAVMKIGPQVDELLISANRNIDCYSRFGKVISDEGWGPLSGLRQGMAASGCAWVFCLHCDTPFFPEDIVHRLKSALSESGAQIAIPETKGKTHHAFMLLQNALLQDLSGFLENGGRKVTEWQRRFSCVKVSFQDDLAFHNVNTPEDLRLAETIFSGGKP